MSYLPFCSFGPSILVSGSAYLLTPPFGIESASRAGPTNGSTTPSADFCSAVKWPLDHFSRSRDTEQISWGKPSRFRCIVAESTLGIFDGYGFRGKLPALPTPAPLFGFCPSTLIFVPCFLQTPPRGGSPCIITRPSPPSGWSEDFHLQAAVHAQHTTKPLARQDREAARVFDWDWVEVARLWEKGLWGQALASPPMTNTAKVYQDYVVFVDSKALRWRGKQQVDG
jgi:hypothetical protein